MKKNYHWLIVAVSVLQMFVIGGVANNLSNLFILPVTASMGIARASYSLALSMRGMTAFLSSFISGSLLHRFGYRKMVSLLMMTSSLALVIMATGKNVITLGMGVALLGFGDGICLNAGPPRIVRHWFHKHQGLVLGCISAATGLGGGTLCVVYSAIIESCGWRAAFWFCAAIYLVMAAMLFAVVRERPEDLGLRPYGEGQYDHKRQEKPEQKWDGFTWPQLRRKGVFYLLVAGCFLSYVCVYSLFQTIIPHLRDIGYSNAQAVAVQSALLLMLAAAKLVIGGLSDRIGGKWVHMICLCCAVAALGIMSVSRNIYAVWTAAVLLACGLPITILTVPLLVPELFGYRAQNMAVGVLLSMASLVSSTAPALTNAIYDRIGTYIPVYTAAAVGMLAMIGLHGVIYWQAGREKRKL